MSSEILILGAGEVAEIEANFLEGDVPRIVLNGPSLEFRPDKDAFERTRIARWFGA